MKRIFPCFLFLFLTSVAFSQTTYNFSTPAALSGSPWKSTATIIIDGVTYVISGGINGGYTNVSTGGNGNSAALKKEGSGGDAFTIKRADGKRFQFYGLWLKQSSMKPYPNTPPYYTIRFMNGTTELRNYVQNTQNTTVTYSENFAVTSVSVMFNALNEYILDDLKVGPAVPSNEAGLGGISLSKSALSPAFSTNQLSYTASADFGTTSIKITPTALDALGATIKVNGQTVASGTAVTISLNPGINTISIECTAENGTVKKTYQIQINRSTTPSYCSPQSNNSEGDNIRSFTLAGEGSGSISDLNTPNVANGYDYRNAVPELSLKQGNTYNGALTTDGTAWSSTDGEHVKIWIDFNDNMTFENDELVYNAPRLITSGSPLSFSMKIAENALTGAHRMRVRAIYEDPYNTTNFSACSDESYGETHDYNIRILPAMVMPVTLMSFNASHTSDKVILSWITASEINLEGYEIEKSFDGTVFSKTGFVSAKNTQGKQTYQWFDQTTVSNMQYYRLAMRDKNGAIEYSKIVKVISAEGSGTVQVVPNPVSGNVLRMYTKDVEIGNWTLALYNALGNKVFTTNLRIESNISEKQIQLPSSITTGVYRMILSRDEKVHSISIMIK